MRARGWIALALGLVSSGAAAGTAGPKVGPSVGDAQALVREARELFANCRQQKRRKCEGYTQAAAKLLDATRAEPRTPALYLSLARSRREAGQEAGACYAYDVFLAAAPPEDPEVEKVRFERHACGTPRTASFDAGKARFWKALALKRLSGPGSAGAELSQLLDAGYLGPDLAELADKLSEAALEGAEAAFQAALGGARGQDALRRGVELYGLGRDTHLSPLPDAQEAHAAFLGGLLALSEPGRPDRERQARAEKLLSTAVAHAPELLEARRLRGLLRARAEDFGGALEDFQAALPEDSRTALLRATVALPDHPEEAATQLEAVLFHSMGESSGGGGR